MSTEEVKVIDKEEGEVKNDNSEVILQKMEELQKQFNELKTNKFDSSEINAIAKQKAFEKNVEFEEAILESEKIRKIQQKGKTDLEIRNSIWEGVLNEFLDGDISPSIFRKIDSKEDNGLSQLLGACLYRYLAPKYGISMDYIDNISLIQAEREFNWKNKPANLIRTFRG